MKPRYRICTVFGDDQRFPQFFPFFQLFSQPLGGFPEIRASLIPSVIPVQADHVGQPGRDICIRPAGHLRAGYTHRSFLRILTMREGKKRFKIGKSTFAAAVRFICDIPHHHAGIVFVSRNQVADDLPVMREGLKAVLPVKGSFLLSIEICAAAESKIQSYSRRLVDDHKAFLVRKPHHFLAVRIMAAAEAVDSLPFHQ